MAEGLEAQVQELAQEVRDLRARMQQQEDIHAIRTLQFKYGYYMDKGLYEQVVDLYAADGVLHFMGGIFRGRAGVSRFYCGRLRTGFTGGHNGPVYGLVCDHMQLQDIVDVAPDGLTAKARVRAMGDDAQ